MKLRKKAYKQFTQNQQQHTHQHLHAHHTPPKHTHNTHMPHTRFTTQILHKTCNISLLHHYHSHHPHHAVRHPSTWTVACSNPNPIWFPSTRPRESGQIWSLHYSHCWWIQSVLYMIHVVASQYESNDHVEWCKHAWSRVLGRRSNKVTAQGAVCVFVMLQKAKKYPPWGSSPRPQD